MLGKRGQDLPIFCQANMRPLCAENPVAPSLCPWGSGSVVDVVREGGAGEEEEEAFLPSSVAREECSSWSLLFNAIPKVLAKTIRQKINK